MISNSLLASGFLISDSGHNTESTAFLQTYQTIALLHYKYNCAVLLGEGGGGRCDYKVRLLLVLYNLSESSTNNFMSHKS